MQFYPTGTEPPPHAELVCRQPRWNLVVLAGIFWAIPVFWWTVDAPWPVTFGCGALALLLTPFFWSAWRARGRANNWVLAVETGGLWLNLRDCLYHRAPPGETVVHLTFNEVASAHRTVHRYTAPSSDGATTHHRAVYLDLELAGVAFEPLRRQLAVENSRSPKPEKHFGGNVKVATRRNHCMPIESVGDDLLRVKFCTSNYTLTPGVKKVLAVIGRYVPVHESESTRREYWATMEDDEVDRLARELARDGHTFDAVELHRRRQQLSLADAWERVEQLCRQPHVV